MTLSSSDAFALNGGAVYDGVGNDALVSVPAGGAVGSLSYTSSLNIDTVIPEADFDFGAYFYSNYSWEFDGTISGASSDIMSEVALVEVQIKRPDNQTFYNGTSWENIEVWNSADGTVSWFYAINSDQFENNKVYAVKVRATDLGGNISTAVSDTFHFDSEAPVSGINLAASFFNEASWSVDSTIVGTASDSSQVLAR